MPFASERLLLRCRGGLTARVRKQSVDDACDVLQMKPDRCDSSWTSPEQLRREIFQETAAFLSRLQQCVSNRLQDSGHSLDRPAKPSFR